MEGHRLSFFNGCIDDDDDEKEKKEKQQTILRLDGW